MGSIRPLVTITILVVVGAYLYVKINEGPVQPRAGANSNWNQSQDGIPPLSTKGASLASETGAPAWPGAATPVTPPTTNAAAPPVAGSNPTVGSMNPGTQPTAGSSKESVPTVPPIPELPELPSTNVAGASANSPAVSPPKDLPVNIPTAQYPDEPGQKALASGSTNTPSLTPLSTNPTDLGKAAATNSSNQTLIVPPTTGSTATSGQNPAAGSAPPQPAPFSPSATAPQSTQQTSTQNPLRPSTQSTPTIPTNPTMPSVPETPDRYGFTAPTATPATPTAPVGPATPQSIAPPAAESNFAASWPAIQSALDRRDLKLAHQLLSKWHNNETLSLADSEKVESLLGQLAGTVIYSTEHQLEPARIVKQGETLETIAKEYNVPPSLLAKINGVQPPGQLRPGQELKVVRGPFSAVVDLHRNEMTLLVDERYAGKFSITAMPGAAVTDGQWVVDQKLTGPPSTANPSSYGTMPNSAERTIILRNAAAGTLAAGSGTLLIAPPSALTGPNPGPPALRVTPQDAEELSDILSIGSRVVVRK